jgi:hypothetical protein
MKSKLNSDEIRAGTTKDTMEHEGKTNFEVTAVTRDDSKPRQSGQVSRR